MVERRNFITRTQSQRRPEPISMLFGPRCKGIKAKMAYRINRTNRSSLASGSKIGYSWLLSPEIGSYGESL